MSKFKFKENDIVYFAIIGKTKGYLFEGKIVNSGFSKDKKNTKIYGVSLFNQNKVISIEEQHLAKYKSYARAKAYVDNDTLKIIKEDEW